MSHRISEEVVAWDAAATLEMYFKGLQTMNDGREYKVTQVDVEDTRLTVEVSGTKFLDVEEEQFEIEVRVRKVDR